MEESEKNNQWKRYLSNKYIWVLLFFIVWMLLLDNYSLINHVSLNKQIDELEDKKKYYEQEIQRDSLEIKRYNNLDQVEKYAREKHFMKKDSEDVYIIEYTEESARNTK